MCGIHGAQTLPGKIPAIVWSYIENMTNNNHGSSSSTISDECHVRSNARQLFASLRGIDYAPDNIGVVDECNQLAPVDISVYCDGGLAHPSSQRWQLGGYGAWHPRRLSPPSELEVKFASTSISSGGVECWASSNSLWSSSTRNALSAGILSMLSCEPVGVLIVPVLSIVHVASLSTTMGVLENHGVLFPMATYGKSSIT